MLQTGAKVMCCTGRMTPKPAQFRAPKPICVYCGKREATTRDHVIPKALFLKTPVNAVTVPSCSECNRYKKRRDDYFRDMLAIDSMVLETSAGRELFEGPYKRAVEGDWSQFTREFAEDFDVVDVTIEETYKGRFVAFVPNWDKVTQEIQFFAKGLTYAMRKQPIPEGFHFDVMRAPTFVASTVLENLPVKPSRVFIMGENREFIAFLDKIADTNGSEHWHFIFYNTVVFGCTVIDPETYAANPGVFGTQEPVPTLTHVVPHGVAGSNESSGTE